MARPFPLFLCLLPLLAACQQSVDHVALGTLERDRIVLKATAQEVIVELPIAEGSKVAAGDLIIQLDTRRQTAAVAKAQANLAGAQANLQKLVQGARPEDIGAAQAQIDNAQAQWIDAQKAFERSATLAKQKLIGQAQWDTALAKRDSAQAAVKQAQENYLLLSHGNRLEDIALAQAQVSMAEAALRNENLALQELSVRATRAGRLDILPKHLGERVGVGEALGVILDKAAPYARVYIPETARALIHNGQNLDVHIDGVAQSYSGQVRWIAEDPAFTPYYALNSSDRARLVFAAHVQLPESAGELPSGLPVQVDLPHE